MADAERLPAQRLLAYGLPGLPLAGLGVPLFIFLPSFYATHLGLGLEEIGLALLLARIWDAASDPLIGHLSDRWRSRIGRRKPWLLLGLVPTCLAVWALFVPEQGMTAAQLFAWSALLYFGWTMIQLPHAAWGAELSGDYHERSRIAAFRETFVVAGTLTAAAIPTLVGEPGGGGPAAMRAFALFLILAFPLAILLASTAVPETGSPATSGRLSLAEGAGLLMANRPFLRLLLAYLLNGLANGMAATLFVLFVGQGLALPEQSDLLLLVYFLAGILGVPVWLAASRRLGKHRAWVAAMLANAAAFSGVLLLDPGDFLPFLVICIATGLCLGADLVLPPSMQADVVDVDTAATGRSRAGLYFALWGMATKLALALAVGIAFPILDAVGFRPTGENAPEALFALALLYGGAPVLLKLAAVSLVFRFPLDAAAQADLRRQIREKSAPSTAGDDP